MKYCTSCGANSTKKVCPSCGIKTNKEHKYCGWCGKELNDNANICTECKTKIKPSKLPSIILSVVGIIALLVSALSIIEDNNFKLAAISFLGFIICLPFITKLITSVTYPNKKIVLKIANIARCLIAVVLIFVSLSSGEVKVKENTVYTDEATAYAVEVFHDNVKLKNEESFVLNDSSVTFDSKGYKGNKNLLPVKVVLDYSAQNGFGGNNRDNYTVYLLYNKTSGKYRVQD